MEVSKILGIDLVLFLKSFQKEMEDAFCKELLHF